MRKPIYEYYELHTGPYIFQVVVARSSYVSAWKIQVGARDTCVVLNIDKADKYIAAMEAAAYHNSCVTDESAPLLRGDNGTVVMIKAALEFVFNYYPKVRGISFIDDSKIDCQTIQGTKIKLFLYYIVKHGCTWYEDKLGAYFGNVHNEYEIKKTEALQEYKEATFEEFQDKYIKLEEDGLTPNIIHIIREEYQDHTTYKRFFKALAKKYDCYVFNGWLERYFRANVKILFDENEWVIPRMSFIDLRVVRIDKDQSIMNALPFQGGKRTQHRATTINRTTLIET